MYNFFHFFLFGLIISQLFPNSNRFFTFWEKSPTVTNKTRICPILWVFLILNYHSNLKIVCENCSLRNLAASNTGTQQPRKLAADKQRRTDDCHNPAFSALNTFSQSVRFSSRTSVYCSSAHQHGNPDVLQE